MGTNCEHYRTPARAGEKLCLRSSFSDLGGLSTVMSGLFWWIGQIALALAGCFFLLFGVHLLVAAYSLNDPFEFIMTFFASNFIILISGAILAGVVIRMIKARKSANSHLSG